MRGVSNPFLILPTNRAAKPGVHRSGYGPVAAFAPRLARLLEATGVLVVLDNLETLLTAEGRWRDPRWEPLIGALCGHGGGVAGDHDQPGGARGAGRGGAGGRGARAGPGRVRGAGPGAARAAGSASCR